MGITFLVAYASSPSVHDISGRLPSSWLMKRKRKHVGVVAFPVQYNICVGHPFMFFLTVWVCVQVTKTTPWHATRSLLLVTPLSAWSSFSDASEMSIISAIEFAHLFTTSKRDWRLQMPAAILVCSFVLEIK